MELFVTQKESYPVIDVVCDSYPSFIERLNISSGCSSQTTSFAYDIPRTTPMDIFLDRPTTGMSSCGFQKKRERVFSRDDGTLNKAACGGISSPHASWLIFLPNGENHFVCAPPHHRIWVPYESSLFLQLASRHIQYSILVLIVLTSVKSDVDW